MADPLLFLHYGPGGNAQVERQWLGKKHAGIEFWDQPRLDEDLTFSHLLQACINKIQSVSSKGPVGIVAHSFGVNLALAALKKCPQNISQLILNSPVRNFPLAFYHLGVRVNQIDNNGLLTQRLQELHRLIQTKATKTETLPAMWAVVGEVAKTSTYLRAYWHQQREWEKYKKIASQCDPLVLSEWQSVLNDYVMSDEDVDSVALQLPVKVFLGAQDPYLDITAESKYWSSKIGNSNLVVIEGCGHYPHLEGNSLKLI